MKRSHRRALAAALTAHRCPSCNRAGGLGLASTRPHPIANCGCGAHYELVYTTTERTVQRVNVRVVATVTGLRSLVG